MKTAVLYYSYTGQTKKLAQQLAEQENAALIEVKDEKRPGTIKAYTAGALAARRQKAWPIAPINEKLTPYEKFFLMGPVWFGLPAPQVNAIIQLLPRGRQVEVILVSGSGKSAAHTKEKVTALIKSKGSKVCAYRDVKGAE